MTVTMAALFLPFKESRMSGKLCLPRVMTGYPCAPPITNDLLRFLQLSQMASGLIRHGRYSGAVARHARNYCAVGVGVCHRVIAIAQAGLRLPESICNDTR